MKGRNSLINLGIIGLLWFSLAFACNNGGSRRNSSASTDNQSRRSSTSRVNPSSEESNSEEESDTSEIQNSGAMPDLPGSKWAVRSITDKGDEEHVFSFQENIDFFKNGKWYMNRAMGGDDGGTYKISGNSLTMYHDEGAVMGEYTLRWDAEENVLEMDSGSVIWRLTYQGVSG